MLAPAFDAVAALLVVHPAGRAVVRAREDPAFAIDFKAVGIAATFGVDFKDLTDRVEAPDTLAFPADVLAALAADVARGRAAVRTVEPAVHAPLEVSRSAVRVLEAEAAEFDFGIADGESALGGVAEEIGRIQHPHASHARQGGGGDVEAFQDVGMLIERAGTLRVFEDGDDVGPFFAAGRRQGDFVELGADVLVVADDLEPGGERVLEILGDPEAPLRIPAAVDGLSDRGLRGHEVDGEVRSGGEFLQRLRRLRGRSVIGHHAAAFEGLHDLFDLFVARLGGIRGYEASGEQQE